MKWSDADRSDIGRDRGILTKSDREFLLGKSDIEEASHSERRARERIRNRLKNAILDMGLLFEHMEERDKEQVFMPDSDTRSALSANSYALALLLDGVGIHRLMQHSKPRGDPSEETLESAFELIGRKRGYLVNDSTVKIDADKIREKALLRHLEEGKELSPEGIRHLLETEKVDTEEVQDTIRSMLIDDE